MEKLEIASDLQEKIFDLQRNDQGLVFRITTYFPLKSKEKQEILNSMEQTKDFTLDFKSIFSDQISETEWFHSKEQIKKKFQDELIDID